MVPPINTPSGDRLAHSLDHLWSALSILSRSIRPIRWIGYGLLLLSVLDAVQLLIPVGAMTNTWELQTLGALVERVPVFLVGLAFTLLGGPQQRDRWEVMPLKLLSWLLLVLGIGFLLLVPLSTIDAIQVDRQNNQQLEAQFEQNKAVMQQVQQQLSQVNTPMEMEQLLNQLSQIGLAPDTKDAKWLAGMKPQTETFLAEGEMRLRNQLQMAQTAQRLVLIKNSMKWNLGAIISSVLLVTLWQSTRWARQTKLQPPQKG